MTFSERHPRFDEQVREIRGPHRGIERRRHTIRVDRQCLDCSGHGGQHRCERVAGIEQQRFVFLQIFLVARRNSLECGQQRDEIAQQAAGLAPRELEDIGIPFLRHEARPRTEVVGECNEPKLATRVRDQLGAKPR